MSNHNCNVCGKFRKVKDLVQLCGDSVDGYEPETWLECRLCTSQVDLDMYFGGVR